jgi:hypothetical protein
LAQFFGVAKCYTDARSRMRTLKCTHIFQPPEGIKFCVKNNAISTSAAQQWASSNGISRDERNMILLEVTTITRVFLKTLFSW